MSCNCNSFVYEMSGGIKVGGSFVLTEDTLFRGGIKIGGSNQLSSTNKVFEMLQRLPLDEDGSPYLDRSGNYLDAIGIVPSVRADGVYCRYSQRFDEIDGKGPILEMDPDAIDGPFCLSLWVNVDNLYAPRTIYSRGSLGTGFDCVFSLETSFLNHVVATVKTSDGEFQCFSSIMLERNRWYHIAVVYDGSNLKIFIGGLPNASCEVTGLIDVTDSQGYIGRKNQGSYFTGNIQEIRLFQGVNDPDWWKCEKKNFCNDLFTLSEEQTSVLA